MNDSGFGLQFRRAERPGFYFRVLNEGEVTAGDGVTLVENPQDGISMLELFRLSYQPGPSAVDLRRALASPIAERMRAKFESRLAAMDG
jgi:MOSC domain-containing protein YiiM